MGENGNIRVGGNSRKRKMGGAKTPTKTSPSYLETHLDFNLDQKKIKAQIKANLKKNDSHLIKLNSKMEFPKSTKSPQLNKIEMQEFEKLKSHWQTEKDIKFPSFKTVGEVQEYIAKINTGMDNAIKEMKLTQQQNSNATGGNSKRKSSPFSPNKTNSKKTKTTTKFISNFENYKIETDKDKVLNDETKKLLNMKELFIKKK